MKKTLIIKELRSFLLLWSSQAVSALGTAMTNYALVIWVYGQEGTASSLTLLTICAFLPTIFFRFIAGTMADRWNKKRIMLLSDLVAAGGTVTVFVLYGLSALRIWHLYLINVLLSLMNAVQTPASFVATSLLVPKEHYTRVSGLQSFSGSIVSILAPALGSCLLAFGGMRVVLLCDLFTFSIAFLVLLFLIRIPEVERAEKRDKRPFLQSSLDGIRYLRSHASLMRLALFFAIVNFLAKLGNDGMISPFVLARTGNNQQALGMVQSAIALGLLAGGLIVTTMKPARRKARMVFITCALIFAGNIAQGLSRQPWVWCLVAFATYMTAAVMNAHLTAILREHVPPEMQGRVFAANDTLKNVTIPLGLFLGGFLADNVLEPFMAADSLAQQALSQLFGTGSGSGIAAIFCAVGVLGTLISLSRLGKPIYHDLNE